MPALPLDEAGKYVAGAYVAFVFLVLIYVAIMAAKLQRIDRELGELAELAERDRGARSPNQAAEGDWSSGGAGRGREAEDFGG
jgi:hypothetical protein